MQEEEGVALTLLLLELTVLVEREVVETEVWSMLAAQMRPQPIAAVVAGAVGGDSHRFPKAGMAQVA